MTVMGSYALAVAESRAAPRLGARIAQAEGERAGASAVGMAKRQNAVRGNVHVSAFAHSRSLGLNGHLPGSGLSCATLYISRMARRMPCCPSPTELSEADAPEVASLYGRCADYFLLQDGVAPTLADANELFTDVPPEKDARDQTVLGWRGDDGLYAIAAILRDYPRNGTWYLGFIIVDATQRGRGFGKSIYAAIEDWAATRGATEIRLAVLEANEAGERFWRSLGFGEVRRVGPDTFKVRSHRRIELSRHINGGFVEGGNQ